jgi:hypothetical protein
MAATTALPARLVKMKVLRRRGCCSAGAVGALAGALSGAHEETAAGVAGVATKVAIGTRHPLLELRWLSY